MGKINTDNYPNRPVSAYQDDDMFILQDNGGETYTTNVGDIKNLADSRIKLEGVQVNGTDLPISGKKVNVDISGKTDLSVIAYTFNSEMGYFKGAYVTYDGKLYEFIQEHTGAWNPSHVREIRASGQYVRTGNGGYNNGDRATCEGYMTKASGNYSHAEGRETQAVGECTHAEGRETIANSIYQHVEGKYNVADNESKYIHIIGNGFDDNNRSNAMTLDWDGNLEVSGDVENGNGEKISDKADKVTNATSGHLAGLDANGNLTDSGVSPTEEVTVEGNPVTFDSPFEQDAKSVVVSVKPIQDLHGYDHPWVGGAGKNKLQMSLSAIKAVNTSGTWNDNIYTVANTTFTVFIDDGDNVTGFKVNGTPSEDCSLRIDSAIEANENYILNGCPADGSYDTYRLSILNRTWGNQQNDTGNGVSFSYNSPSVHLSMFVKAGYNAQNLMFYPMIRLSTESDATFAPYSNICPISGIDEVEIGVSDGEGTPTTTTIPLPSTLYDGDVNVTNGDADENNGFVEFDGSSDEDWYKESGYNLFTILVSGLPTVSNWGYPIPNWLTNIGIIFAESTNSGAENHTISFNGSYLYVKSNIATVEDFKTWLANNPIQVLYPLATPTTLSFDPKDVELLEGTNVVSTNGEKVAVTYGRSLWQDIDDLKTDTEGKLDKSDVATIEGDTASKAYSVNDFMLRADGLYKVTAPIASGASITASNTTKTTVGEVLTALLNA